jgi:hypothetical protein
MLTEEQQQTIDKMALMMTAQFEAANARLAQVRSVEPKKKESAETQANRAAAMRHNGDLPEGIMVMKDGKAIILERDEAIIALKEGAATLN